MKTDDPALTALLERMQYEADPLADRTMARILGPWQHTGGDAAKADVLADNAVQWQRLALVNQLIDQWKDNRCTTDWRAPPGTPPEVAGPLEAYLREVPGLPDWADPAQIARAEALFMDQGALSCILLFCASLPECYVVPDLSQALHVTGQLEEHTEYRIRATAAMIFPVMLDGGLTSPQGGGVAQVLKVRLIHATVRNLILRGNPEDTLHALGERRRDAQALRLAPVESLKGTAHKFQALFAHGWNVGQDGLPCNQEELAYTLLTFHYVVLRGLRRLGVGLPEADERAYLHAWNVMGHLLGIRRDLMVETMDEAEALFQHMQSRGRAHPFLPDPRPALGRALMQTMERLIPLRLAKPVPTLLTRHLCGRDTARDIGIDGTVAWPSRLLFALLIGVVRGIDTLARLVWHDFSIARFLTRLIGRQLMAQVLMDQTRPLRLPDQVLAQAQTTMAGWHADPKAPGWLNAVERRLMKNTLASAMAPGERMTVAPRRQ